MARDRSPLSVRPGRADHLSEERVRAGEHGEAGQRASLLGELRDLLRELGFNPGDVISGLGVEIDALHSVEYRIPFAAVGRRLNECAVKTGCPHFGLLLGQRAHLWHLGLPGQMALYATTLREAVRNFAVYQHLNSQG